MQGTPVKSWSSTRAGRNAISSVGRGGRIPLRERADVVGRDIAAVLTSKEVLEEDAQRERQALEVEAEGLCGRVEAVDRVRLAANGKLGARPKSVE